MAADGIYLINKDNTWSILLRLIEKIANSRCSNSDEHLDKICSRDRKERYACFTSNCASQKRLSCSGRAEQQYSSGDFPAKPLEFRRLFQKFDNFLKLDFCFITP